MITKKHLFILTLSVGCIYVIKNTIMGGSASDSFKAKIRPVTSKTIKKTGLEFEKMGNLRDDSTDEEADSEDWRSVHPSHYKDTVEVKYYKATKKVMEILQNKAFEGSKNYLNNMINLVKGQQLRPSNANQSEEASGPQNRDENSVSKTNYGITNKASAVTKETTSSSVTFQNTRRYDSADSEALFSSMKLPQPRSLDEPVLAVAERDRIRHNTTWHGYTKPIIVFKPLGRLGNVMGAYASVWAVGKAYGANVFMEEEVEKILRPVFPRLSMSTLPVKFVGGSWVFLTRGGPNLTNYTPLQEAAAGLRGARTFMVDEYPFEMQLFNAYRDDILKEFTLSLALQTQAQQFLRSVANNNATNGNFVGVHVRRTDYPAFLKKVFRSAAPGADYLQRALAFYRRRLPGATFVAASDDPDYLRETLGGEDDVVWAPGSPRELDLAVLAACNHTIVTGGSYGFWAAYLAGGSVVYPDLQIDQYYFTKPFYKRAALVQFIPLPP